MAQIAKNSAVNTISSFSARRSRNATIWRAVACLPLSTRIRSKMRIASAAALTRLSLQGSIKKEFPLRAALAKPVPQKMVALPPVVLAMEPQEP